MNRLLAFVYFYKAEFLRTSKSVEHMLFLFLPIPVTLLSISGWVYKTHDQYLSVSNNDLHKNVWQHIIRSGFLLDIFIIPLLFIFLIVYHIDTDYKRSIWRYSMTIPFATSLLLPAKQLVLYTWFIVQITLLFTVFVSLPFILPYANPQIPEFASHAFPTSVLFLLLAKYSINMLALLVFQTTFSFILPNRPTVMVLLPIVSFVSLFGFTPYNCAPYSIFKIVLYDTRKEYFGENLVFLTKYELFTLITLCLFFAFSYKLRFNLLKKKI